MQKDESGSEKTSSDPRSAPFPEQAGASMQRFQRLTALLSLGLTYFSPVTSGTWDSLLHAIRRRFPTVRQISTAELAAWLEDPQKSPPVLIDARHRWEFEVSHLPGARHATSVGAARRLGLMPQQPIVVYCSVGYRSSALAEKLRRAGFPNVANLEGSIFAWANEGRKLLRGTREVTRVHPYNARWGELLEKTRMANGE